MRDFWCWCRGHLDQQYLVPLAAVVFIGWGQAVTLTGSIQDYTKRLSIALTQVSESSKALTVQHAAWVEAMQQVFTNLESLRQAQANTLTMLTAEQEHTQDRLSALEQTYLDNLSPEMREHQAIYRKIQAIEREVSEVKSK